MIVTTEKLRDDVCKLKGAPPRLSSSRVIYEVSCPGCSYRYAGQTARHLLTRLQEHSSKDALVSKHFVSWHEDPKLVLSSCKILDKAPSISLLLSLEALCIGKLQPNLNSRGEFRSKELPSRLNRGHPGITVWFCYVTNVFQVLMFCYVMCFSDDLY